jgi:hypothetical protein
LAKYVVFERQLALIVEGIVACIVIILRVLTVEFQVAGGVTNLSDPLSEKISLTGGAGIAFVPTLFLVRPVDRSTRDSPRERNCIYYSSEGKTNLQRL